MIIISLSLYRTEQDILKADPNDLQEKDKKTTRKLHHNPLIEKFYAGQRDEKYVQDYYELLKKADRFKRKSTPHKIAVTADKYHMNYGQKDQYGKRYEHYGFFDKKHKHTGKTMGEVLMAEYEERRSKDDNYELLYIFNNIPIEVGLINIMDVVEKTKKENVDFEYEVQDIFRKSKQFMFPITINRENNDVADKIEQLTEFLHIKKIGFEYRRLEFFIPLKFNTENVIENSDTFKELIDIKQVFIRNDYGILIGFGITSFVKRIKHNDTHEIWKFDGIEMENVRI
jgi:hypothetical protein